ncbi:MAG: helix-turn-helix domain-containing protein [Acidobacteriota bacterium]
MIGKPVALIQVPNQRLFSPRAAARYLGIHVNTLKKYSDLGLLSPRQLGNSRTYTLEELDRFIEDLPKYNADGEKPGLSPHHKEVANGNL